MLTLTVKNAYTYISGISPGQFPHCIYNSLLYIASVDNETKKGKITKSLLDKDNMRFPTGTLYKVTRALKANNIEYEINDETEYLDKNPVVTGIHLRPYQEDSIRHFTEGDNDYGIKGRGILDLATGAGKTTIAIQISAIYNQPTIFFVHTKDLLFQAKKKFKESFGVENVGSAGGGIEEDYMDENGNIRQFVVAMIQSLAYHGKKKGYIVKKGYEQLMKTRKVAFFDECHHSQSDTWFWVGLECPAGIRCGLSGTPWSEVGNDILLEAVSGPVVSKITAQELVAKGWLSKPDIKLYLVDSEIDPKFYDKEDEENSWHRLYKVGIVFNPHRNAIIVSAVQKALKQNKSILVIVNHKIHGALVVSLINKLIAEDYPDSKNKAIFINSTFASKERDLALELFRVGKIKVIVGTPIFDEGVDLPIINTCIMAAGGKSERRTIQRLGRALRLGENCLHKTAKKNCNLFGSEECPFRCIELQKNKLNYDDIEVEKVHEFKMNYFLRNIKYYSATEWEVVVTRTLYDLNSKEILQVYNQVESLELLGTNTGIAELDDTAKTINKLYGEVGNALQDGNIGESASILKGTIVLQDGKAFVQNPTPDQKEWVKSMTEKSIDLFVACCKSLAINEVVSNKCPNKTFKNTVELIDFMDSADKILRDHSMNRLRTYDDEGHLPMPGSLDEFSEYPLVKKTEGIFLGYEQMMENYGQYLSKDIDDDKNI